MNVKTLFRIECSGNWEKGKKNTKKLKKVGIFFQKGIDEKGEIRYTNEAVPTEGKRMNFENGA